MSNNNIETSLLYDFYGQLLNDAQQRVIELYVNDDLSLSETAEILKISRQGVRDTLKRATDKLHGYEQKLGLYKQFVAVQKGLSDIIQKAQDAQRYIADQEAKNEIDQIADIATSLLE